MNFHAQELQGHEINVSIELTIVCNWFIYSSQITEELYVLVVYVRHALPIFD